jgi:hypothetical protein
VVWEAGSRELNPRKGVRQGKRWAMHRGAMSAAPGAQRSRDVGNEVGEQFVLKNGTDFLLVLLIRIDALSVNDVFRVFDEAPCCFCGAAIRY